MKETGIIRRIDELGRIVIPKEIRKRLRVSSGDFLDIYSTDEYITLKKYSILDDYAKNILDLIRALKKDDLDFIVCDNQEILVTTIDELKKGLQLTSSFLNMFLKNHDLELSASSQIEIVKDYKPLQNIYAKKLYKDGDFSGIIIMLSKEAFMKNEKDHFEILDKYISAYMKSE